ncbi:ComF family protein [Duganella qianjiadongensis]|uniref:ComF family protein n=1 Tax=Duganella qianjiadongensis TaxID=2692176 RepID=A0ABW9VK79_9BURK|nr:ComF family protein [Duganella qianjiadongensis]MYM38934.1 ComF family protein [Duganella qianjiadongensis]
MFAADALPRSLAGTLRRYAVRLLDTVLPPACALCGDAQAGALLCPACCAQFFSAAASGPRCRCCANPLPSPLPPGLAMLCGQCQQRRPAYDQTVVACTYALPLDRLVLQLKFGQRLAYAGLMAQQLRDAILRQPHYRLPDLLCPVPLGPRRLAERGYNQALEIARPLARQLGIPLAPRLLLRVRETAPQSLVSATARQHNLAGAFAVSDVALVRGRHIGMVDDVMTSGSTLQEIAATLRRYGASRISNLVFARTPPH